MENRRGTRTAIEKRPPYVFYFLFSILLMESGCGAPGEPVPPMPPVPVAIKDLAAHQIGDGVQLAFTLPTSSVTEDRLPEPPAVEIVRGVNRPDGTPDAKSFRIVDTIPGALVTDFVTQKRVEYIDVISPRDPETSAGATLVYRVRTRASRKRGSADSNTVFVQVSPVPQRILAVESRVTESAIELNWAVPATPSSGALLTAPLSYHVYRAEVDPAAFKADEEKHSLAEVKSPPVLLATVITPSYQDTAFEFGKSRSEEHTSELQSPDHLVCRLLLEKKKTYKMKGSTHVKRPLKIKRNTRETLISVAGNITALKSYDTRVRWTRCSGVWVVSWTTSP